MVTGVIPSYVGDFLSHDFVGFLQTFVEEGYTVEQVGEALQRQNEGCPDLSLTECQRQVTKSIKSWEVPFL